MSDQEFDSKITDILEERGFALERIDEPNDALALIDLEDDKFSPLVVDFLSAPLLHRLRHGLSKGQPLSKAIGIKSLNPEVAPFVIDCTAGLGTDAFMMAALGCRVHAIERSPVIFRLLEDGVERLASATAIDAASRNEFDGDETADIDVLETAEMERFEQIAARLTFEEGDARELLEAFAGDERPDVIYLDPMYPDDERAKSALPKKTMQMFRRLLDGDEDAESLWKVAMRIARSRVVVKRPLKAPVLGEKRAHAFEGKTARYDLYLTGNDKA